MAVHEIRRGLACLAPLLTAGILGAACSGAPAPARPQTQPAPAPTPAPAAPAPAPPTPAPSAPPRDDRVVVIDPGTEDRDDSKSLAQIAQEEKERRARSEKPVAVITNKTLPAYASKGKITVATPGPSPSAAPADAAPAERGEEYWRSRGLEIRRRWRAATEEIERLEQSAADLRRRFYSEDDPYRRDGQIKPEWDRVLDRIEETRIEAKAAEKELARFLEEGREVGALPGWLREGAEEEPAREEEPPAEPEAVEPPELGEGPP